MRVKIKKLHPDAKIPEYAKPGDAGLDLVATRKITNTSYLSEFGTGLAIELPDGFVGLVFPRSSVRGKDLVLSNSVGVIDSGYRGEIIISFRKTNGLDSDDYKVGDRIAQLVIVFCPKVQFDEVEELETSERGEGGFGSTNV